MSRRDRSRSKSSGRAASLVPIAATLSANPESAVARTSPAPSGRRVAADALKASSLYEPKLFVLPTSESVDAGADDEALRCEGCSNRLGGAMGMGVSTDAGCDGSGCEGEAEKLPNIVGRACIAVAEDGESPCSNDDGGKGGNPCCLTSGVSADDHEVGIGLAGVSGVSRAFKMKTGWLRGLAAGSWEQTLQEDGGRAQRR